MLIIGAKGFASEVFSVLMDNNYQEEIFFYDDVNRYDKNFLYGKQINTSINQIEFNNEIFSNHFTIGIGNPKLRKLLDEKFTLRGFELISVISNKAFISNFNVKIESGVVILPFASISPNVVIGRGAMIYYNSIITHDCIIGDYVEISPGATILGNCQIGSLTHLGSNCTILPKIKIGNNVIVAAGAVVTKDVPDNCMVAGIPAKVKKIYND